MIGHRKDILDNMIKRNCCLVVMGHNEFTTVIPEYAHFELSKFWTAARRIRLRPGRPGHQLRRGKPTLLPGDPQHGKHPDP